MNRVCASCGAPVSLGPTTGRLPYWCPRCGTDLKTREVEVAPEVLAAAAAPLPLELAALPDDYSKKWSSGQPNKPKVPAWPGATEVFADKTAERVPAPTTSPPVPE